MINPTGGIIRIDNQGAGHFNAPRTGGRRHDGIDLECDPGQEVLSPISGTITRVAYPYAGDLSYTGCVIENGRVTVKIFYIKPNLSLIGTDVIAGQPIGLAQDIRRKYGLSSGMLAHIHLEVERVDPMFFLEMP